MDGLIDRKFRYIVALVGIMISMLFGGVYSVRALEVYKHAYYSDTMVGATNPYITRVDTTNTDLIRLTVSLGTNRVSSFYIEDVNDRSNSMNVSVVSNTTTYYLSLRNGTYRLYLLDATGMASAFSQTIVVNSSCSNETKYGVTGSGTLERCFIYRGTERPAVDVAGEFANCQTGYVLDQANSGLAYDYCEGYSLSSLTNYSLTERFCKRVYKYSCVKQNVSTTSSLKTLSLSNGTLSPAFNPDVTTYTATVNKATVDISATLNNDGSSFETSYGPRSVSLQYGTNTVLVKVKSSSGNVKTYTITITRQDDRSKVNTLKSLSIDGAKLNQTFNGSTTSYTANVDNSVTKVYVNAERTSSDSSFVTNYGPRTVSLVEGVNTVLIKVKSEAGTTRTYTIKITRAAAQSKPPVEPDPEKPDDPVVNPDELALLASLTFQDSGVKLEPTFDPKVFDYNVTVPYEVSALIMTPVAKNSVDQISIVGHEDLKVEDTNVVTIKVTTADNFVRTYTINVIRKGQDLEISDDSSLVSLEIENHEIEFASDTKQYDIILKKKETELIIDAKANSEAASVEVLDNEDLKLNSVVIVRVTAEDGTYTDYELHVTKVEKGANIFLIIIIVILLVLVIAYTILRILGYKIYFNLSMLGSLFRSGKNSDE